MRFFLWPFVQIARGVGVARASAHAFFLRNRPTLVILTLFLLFLVIYFFPHIFIFVNSGEMAVKYRRFAGGTVLDRVYGEGTHVIFPWDRMYIYNVQVQELDYEVDLLDENALRLRFELSIRYYPERDMLAVLHQRVGQDYVEKIVVPEVVSVLRTYVGRYTAEEIVNTQRAILDRIFNQSIENVNQNYVTINQVIIRTIELPPAIQQAVEEKITQRHIAEAYEYRLLKEQKEAKRKEIEALGFKTYNETIAASLSPEILKWKGIEATRELAESTNTKVIVVGNGDGGLPIILGGAAP